MVTQRWNFYADFLACIKNYWAVDTWGTCPLVDFDCDPFEGTGCPGEDHFCYAFESEMTGHTVCLSPGTSVELCQGTDLNECEPGRFCNYGECRILCDGSHLCEQGDCSPTPFGQYGICL